MARKNKLKLGKDAVVSVLAKYIHPSEHIRRVHRNAVATLRIENLTVLRQDKRRINRKEKDVVVFVSEAYRTSVTEVPELYAVVRYVSVITEGPREHFFDQTTEAGAAGAEGENPNPMPDEVIRISRRSITDEDMIELRGVVQVDDDNEPVPENVPDGNPTNSILAAEFGHSGVCPRRMMGAANNKAKINFANNIHPTRLQLFELFFPMAYVREVLLVETNKILNGKELEYGEFLRWIGLWLLMSTIQGFQRRDFWSVCSVDMYSTAPYRFNDIMSRNRFEDILSSLSYTNRDPPGYRDPFWEVRQCIECWNANMSDVFVPGWISCLDESMSKWMNDNTCPGFMFVPRKPWPFGNEFHTIACGVSGILYAMELVEGKDEPREKPAAEFSNLGKTVGLLLRLTKTLWGTAKCVVLDSGFCVVKGIVELKKRGVFSAALIKKRRYWPKYIDGDRIKQHFESKDIGAIDALRGELDEVPFHVFGMKEENYVMMLMSTYGTLSRVGEERYRRVGAHQQRISFQYPELVYNHFQYRDAVDSHNARRMAPIALEETWQTKRWANRIFSYLIATTEVNCNNGESAFGETEGTRPQLEFRRLLAKDLIYNHHVVLDDVSPRASKRLREQLGHELLHIPCGKKFSGTRLVDSMSDYAFNFCSCRVKRVRTYCKCSPGTLLCQHCFVAHCNEVSATS
jgi:hypothetical protein